MKCAAALITMLITRGASLRHCIAFNDPMHYIMGNFEVIPCKAETRLNEIPGPIRPSPSK